MKMFKKNLSSRLKALSLILSVMVATTTIALVVLAQWTEPTQPPPGGNVAAPINVGSSEQRKSGRLDIGGNSAFWIEKSGNSFALENASGQVRFVIGQDGNVGIGTANPDVKFHVEGSETNTVLGSNTVSAIRITNTYSGTFNAGGELQFEGPDGPGTDIIGTIRTAYNAYSAAGIGGDMFFGTKASDANPVQTRMTILGNGNVGIGTVTPTTRLHVHSGALRVGSGSTDPTTTDGAISLGNIFVDFTPTSSNWTLSGSTMVLSALNYSTIAFHDSGNRVDFIRAGDGTIQLGYNGGFGEANIRMPGTGIWNSSGNVGIGTASPGAKLEVKSSGQGQYAVLATQSGSANMLGAISEEIGGHGALILRNNGGTFSQIKSEGNSSLMGGNVGIGIKDPIDKLHIWGGTNGILLEAPLGGGVSQQGVFLKGDNNVYSSFQRWWSNASFMAQNLVLRDGNWSRANATRSLMFSMRDTSSTETFAWSSWTGASAPYTANYLMRLQDDGHLYIDGSYHCNGADYAEYFYTEDAKIKPGELVQAAISPDSVEKSISNANILGIVSTNPGVVGSLPKGEQKEQTPIDETALLPNGEEQAPADDYYTRLEKDPHWKPIGLLGKAPVIVVSINGDLNMNDFVSASQIPGIGMKATKSGFVVGQALESSTDWNKDNCQAVADYDSISWPEDDGSNPAKPCFQVLVSSFSPEIQSELQKEYQLLNNDYLYIGKLMLFIRPSFYSQDVFLSDMNGLELLRENQGYSLRDGLGKIIDRIGAFAEIMAAKIRVGTLEAKEIIIDGINILERLNEQQKKIEKLEERIEFLENR